MPANDRVSRVRVLKKGGDDIRPYASERDPCQLERWVSEANEIADEIASRFHWVPPGGKSD
jgi:hypothetical protein